jgi:hypothetical protein
MFASPVKKNSLRLAGHSLKNLTPGQYLQLQKAPDNTPLDYPISPKK